MGAKSRGIFAYDCAAGENLLYAGLRQGITLPYEGGTGTCGTCRARVMEGEVALAWREAPGLAKLKLEKRDILLCQARAGGDCVVRVPSANVADGFTRGVVPGHFNGRITASRRLTHDVLHFEVDLENPMSFDAGQFVAIQAPRLTGGRAYSMVNFGRNTHNLSFVVKRKPGGGFSDWLFDQEIDGSTLGLFGPLGAATFYPDEGKNILCIGGGSGIAGMMSILSRACQENYFRDHKGHMFFGVRTLADCFYLRELSEAVALSGGNLTVTVALSDEPPAQESHPDFPNLKLAGGFVHEAASQGMAGKFNNVVGYVAGPPPMVDASLRLLIAEGRLPPADIRYDKFS